MSSDVIRSTIHSNMPKKESERQDEHRHDLRALTSAFNRASKRRLRASDLERTVRYQPHRARPIPVKASNPIPSCQRFAAITASLTITMDHRELGLNRATPPSPIPTSGVRMREYVSGKSTWQRSARNQNRAANVIAHAMDPPKHQVVFSMATALIFSTRQWSWLISNE